MIAAKIRIGAALTLLVTQLAFAQTSPAVELEGAIAREQVNGDLKAAISAYQKIAAETFAPRDVRAKALLHLAGCYEKLGQQESRKVYEQIVRDFGDQPSAVQARQRLAALKQINHLNAPATMTLRKIEPPAQSDVGPDPNQMTDGHYLVYRNDRTGELIFGDLSGKIRRVIYKGRSDDEPRWMVSRDFSMVALLASVKADQQQILTIVNTNGSGYREIARLDPNPYYYSVTWSWDNRYLLIDGSIVKGRLLRISVADGRVRELLHLNTLVDWSVFSPDGRFVAFRGSHYRIFVVPAAGGQPQAVYEESPVPADSDLPRLFDWTPDGRYLVVSSNRNGKGALYLLPIHEGKSAGAPIFVRYGDFECGRMLPTGKLIYSAIKPGGAWAVHLTSIQSNGRLGEWKRLGLQLGNDAKPWVRFSDDGNQLVYVATSEDAGQNGEAVRLQNLSTGEDRVLYQAPHIDSCIWKLHQRELLCVDQRTEKWEVVSIVVDSGESSHLHVFEAHYVSVLSLSSDDRFVYLYAGDIPAGGNALVRWEVPTGKETILEREPADVGVPWPSPDERWLVWPRKHGFESRPTTGQDWKNLVSLNRDEFVPKSTLGVRMGNGGFAFTPDGNWFVYLDIDSAGKHSLFRVPLTGGKPERLGDLMSESFEASLSISPDGRQVVAESWEGSSGFDRDRGSLTTPALPHHRTCGSASGGSAS